MEDSSQGQPRIPDDFFYDRFGAKPRRKSGIVLFVFSALFLAAALFCYVSSAPPKGFPTNSVFRVTSGSSLSRISDELSASSLIRSSFLFETYLRFSGKAEDIKAGDYFFDKPQTIFEIAGRLTRNEFNLTSTKVTIPEGLSSREVAPLLKKALPFFDEKQFIAEAVSKEGFLFPDTYLFLPNVTPKEVIHLMEETFMKRVATIEKEIWAFKKPIRDIVIMASIVEKEARTTETRQKIAGILWKRLAKRMPLPVDVVFPYIFEGKPFDLTDGDLKVDSPYNTYLHARLPPGPITNPSLDSIRAAVTPIETPYFYYLADKKGEMYYAVTYEEHVRN